MLIYLLRHGLTQENLEKRYQGRRDVPLCPQGLAQLRRADFAPKTVMITSLQRTRQTAEVLFPDAELVVADGLKEMDFGVFEGRNYREMEHDPQYRAWMGSAQDGTPNGPKLHSIIVDPRDASHLYMAMSGGGVHESTDRGHTFRPLVGGLQVVEGFDPTDITFHEDVLEGEFNDHPYWLRSTAAPLSTPQAPSELPAATEPLAAIESEAAPDAEPVLGRRDRAARLREAGWSNKSIADELGVHASTVGRWFTPPVEEPETTTEMETTS